MFGEHLFFRGLKYTRSKDGLKVHEEKEKTMETTNRKMDKSPTQ